MWCLCGMWSEARAGGHTVRLLCEVQTVESSGNASSKVIYNPCQKQYN